MSQKIAMTGSLRWEDKTKIKNTIFSLKKRFGKEREIVCGGLNTGADLEIKKTCMEFEIEYYEMPPYNYQWNSHCMEPAYMYGKQYNSSYIYMRNEKLAKECSVLVLFMLTEDTANHINHLMQRFDSKSKKILVIN